MNRPLINVVKMGGAILEDEAQRILALSAFASLLGSNVLVHGGGKLATELAKKLGVPVTIIEGRRVTDASMLEIVSWVYAATNKQVVAQLKAKGCKAIGLCGADAGIITAKRRTGWKVDYGFVGDIEGADGATIFSLLEKDFSPVFAPLTDDGNGTLLNTNADTIAATVAQALLPFASVRLVYTFALPGVMEDPDDPATIIHHLTPNLYQQYKSSGIISEGMIPKLDNAFTSLSSGVTEVVICQSGEIGNLGKEGFVGTSITY
ncbi:MAG: acetylglutamate kinase [Bacteroidota bacterium]